MEDLVEQLTEASPATREARDAFLAAHRVWQEALWAMGLTPGLRQEAVSTADIPFSPALVDRPAPRGRE